jgi:glycine cleavage system regulatory protein
MVVTFVGEDRPGLVDRLASTVAGKGGNWEAGRMARLAGKFAGIVQLSVPAERAGDLESELRGIGTAEGLALTIDRGSDTPAVGEQLIHLEVTAADRPGIVRDVSRVLARRGANIDRLETAVASAPHSGEILFHAHADVRLPAALAVEVLVAELEQLADELVIDLSVRKPV